MRAIQAIFATMLSIGGSYGAYPYVTLYQLDQAMRGSDAAALGRLVDWVSVREGIKEDICDYVLDEPATPRPSTELPPFGASFVRGITANAVEQNITAESIAFMASGGESSPGSALSRHADVHVSWAFFDGPTAFSVNLTAAGTAEPIRVHLELIGTRWQVRRVWLPPGLLEQANSGT